MKGLTTPSLFLISILRAMKKPLQNFQVRNNMTGFGFQKIIFAFSTENELE